MYRPTLVFGVISQNSGAVWAFDPDDDGAILWSTQVGKGCALGGIHWRMATDGRVAFAPNSDRGAVVVVVNPDRNPSPDLHALELMAGEIVWSTPPPDDACDGKQGCFLANSAGAAAIPDVVFAGGPDGRILLNFDTTGVTGTSNGVPGRGGAIVAPGPVIAGGMFFVNSGYAPFRQMPGNFATGVRAQVTGGDVMACGGRPPEVERVCFLREPEECQNLRGQAAVGGIVYLMQPTATNSAISSLPEQARRQVSSAEGGRAAR